MAKTRTKIMDLSFTADLSIMMDLSFMTFMWRAYKKTLIKQGFELDDLEDVFDNAYNYDTYLIGINDEEEYAGWSVKRKVREYRSRAAWVYDNADTGDENCEAILKIIKRGTVLKAWATFIEKVAKPT